VLRLRRAIRYITRITASPLRTMVRLRVVSLLSLSLRGGCTARFFLNNFSKY
jgi:hypothetical protein